VDFYLSILSKKGVKDMNLGHARGWLHICVVGSKDVGLDGTKICSENVLQ